MAQYPDWLLDPQWLPHAIVPASDAIEFVHWTREAHRAATFLSQDYLKPDQARQSLALSELARVAMQPSQPLHFVFHSAFCCSTLMARLLDLPGVSMGLKEPAVLNDVAALKRQGLPTERLLGLLGPVLTLLSRPLGEGESTIVKPGNGANGLIADILDQVPTARALFMYSALPTFLRSIAKKGLWGRRWARGLYAQLQPDSSLDPGFDPAEVLLQSDLQVAAIAWLMHQAQFFDLLKRCTPGRIRSLEGETLVAQPAQTLQAVAALFALRLAPAAIANIAGGETLRRDSKTHERSFDASQRRAEHQQVNDAHGEEIAMVLRWAEAVAGHCGVPMTLPAGLLD
ncbi:MAG: hypothetical protein M3Y32_13465 [Pseudomonadota bacterium]|nr:hypothetical protein [Pseudomonadota bacterium]